MVGATIRIDLHLLAVAILFDAARCVRSAGSGRGIAGRVGRRFLVAGLHSDLLNLDLVCDLDLVGDVLVVGWRIDGVRIVGRVTDVLRVNCGLVNGYRGVRLLDVNLRRRGRAALDATNENGHWNGDGRRRSDRFRFHFLDFDPFLDRRHLGKRQFGRRRLFIRIVRIVLDHVEWFNFFHLQSAQSRSRFQMNLIRQQCSFVLFARYRVGHVGFGAE